MNQPQPTQHIRLILGDQLNASHSWFKQRDDKVLYVLMEMRQETDYVRHHRQKVVAFFAAMRSFAKALTKAGHRVHYLSLDDAENQQSLPANLANILATHQLSRVEIQEPDEYRLDHQLRDWAKTENVTIDWYDSEHFFTARDSLTRYFPKAKREKSEFLMETFYRQIRREFNVLMEDKKPLGGKWNYDHDNRKKLPNDHQLPEPFTFANNVENIDQLLTDQQVETMGDIDAKEFLWPINRSQARELLTHFLTHGLANFGRYQDAMTTSCWSLYHSRLSFALNTKMINPKEVIDAAIEHWQAHQDEITIAQIEGFVRQIIGWREFIRGIYWHHMPEYKTLNFFDHKRQLPNYFWTGDTKLACVSHAIKQSLEYAYAHHIQRLMITGNFMLLTGLDPDAVDAWYLGIYIDAIEWVELPNTRGMSQFADGGIVGSKPYVSSGNYIQKMSHYCKDCHYSVKKTTGKQACPFNSLYWRFIDESKSRLQDNHRMSMMFKLWEKRSAGDRADILKQAEAYLIDIENL